MSVFGRAGGFSPNPDKLETTNDKSWSRFGQGGVGFEFGYTLAVTSSFIYELNLGYAQMAGFRLERQDVTLNASVRELPTLSVYGVWVPGGTGQEQTQQQQAPAGSLDGLRALLIPRPYYGASVGFSKLQNASMSTPDGTYYALEAVAFTVGGSLGLSFGSSAFAPFIEGGYRYRNFPSLGIKPKSDLTVPMTVPRSLDFSGWHVDVGLQIGIAALRGEPEISPRPPGKL